jgi:hypothetical protein
MRHSKIDAILELIDGALAGYTVDGPRPAPAGAPTRPEARSHGHRRATADVH